MTFDISHSHLSPVAAFSSLPSLGESWIMVAAMMGGIFVFLGLLREKIEELKTESHKVHHLLGWTILMVGIIAEIGVAGWSAEDDFETRELAQKDDPMRQPLVTTSATARIYLVLNSWKFGDPWFPPDTNSGLQWHSEISFLSNSSNILLTLHAYSLPDGGSGQSGCNFPLKHGTGREYIIEYTPDPMYELYASPTNSDPIERFNNVQWLCVTLPQFDTNSRVLHGSVVLKVNSSLWYFGIPAQNQKWDLITSQIMTNSEGRIVFGIHPEKVVEWRPYGNGPAHWYFGN